MLIIKNTDKYLEPVAWDGGYNPIYKYKGELFTGIMQYVEKDGHVSLEQEYKEGIKGGSYKSFYPDGSLESEGMQPGGNMFDGPYKSYYQNGKLYEDFIFAYFKIVSGKSYDEDGKVIKDYG